MKTTRHADGERILAVFLDFENIGIGLSHRRDRFDISRVLERLVEKGKIVAKKAYADWSRFSQYTSSLHEAAIELVEIPRRAQTGKNSADIRLCVDAMDLAYSKDHIDTFVIVSGDSDFSPLVSKLKELGKHVIGLGLAEATSDLLRDNCDEFIYYEDLGNITSVLPSVMQQLPEGKRKVFELLVDSLLALRRENKEILWSSMVKDTMKRKKPSFNEEYHGYRTFSELLEDAQSEGLLELEKHKTSGTYVVTRFGGEPPKPGAGPKIISHPTASTKPAAIAPLPAAPASKPAAIAPPPAVSVAKPATIAVPPPTPPKPTARPATPLTKSSIPPQAVPPTAAPPKASPPPFAAPPRPAAVPPRPASPAPAPSPSPKPAARPPVSSSGAPHRAARPAPPPPLPTPEPPRSPADDMVEDVEERHSHIDVDDSEFGSGL